jgi:hypothetical protein
MGGVLLVRAVPKQTLFSAAMYDAALQLLLHHVEAMKAGQQEA